MIFIWDRVEEATDSYHSEGGVVVHAETLERAIALAEGEGVKFSDDERMPDATLATTEEGEFVRIFPDAGCC